MAEYLDLIIFPWVLLSVLLLFILWWVAKQLQISIKQAEQSLQMLQKQPFTLRIVRVQETIRSYEPVSWTWDSRVDGSLPMPEVIRRSLVYVNGKIRIPRWSYPTCSDFDVTDAGLQFDDTLKPGDVLLFVYVGSDSN